MSSRQWIKLLTRQKTLEYVPKVEGSSFDKGRNSYFQFYWEEGGQDLFRL